MLDLASVSSVLGDPTRARILEELLGGVPLPAGALAVRVGVAASTASAHLARLEDAGLIVVQPRGRRREARLASAEVAAALEALGRLTRPASPRGLRDVTRHEALRTARSCYDHLAGRASIALADALVARGALERRDDGFVVPDRADDAYAALGVDLAAVRARRRILARPCQDWTERHDHLAGGIGSALLTAFLDRDWLRRRPDTRALTITDVGRRGLAELGAEV